MVTLPETNITLKIGLPKRKLVLQPSIFRGYVSFREGSMFTNTPPPPPEVADDVEGPKVAHFYCKKNAHF